MNIYYKLLSTLLITSVFISCGTSNIYKPVKEIESTLYRDIQSKDSISLAQIKWQDFFSDNYLQSLIQKGLDHNLDLKIGVERIEKANALLKQSKAFLAPNLEITTDIRRSRISDTQGLDVSKHTTDYDLFATVSWEIDIWGKLTSSKRSAYYRFLQTKEVQQVIRTSLISQIADYYYQLLALDKQQSILQQTIQKRALDVHTMSNLKNSNVVTGADLMQSEANYYAAQADLPRINRQIREVENALSVLLGDVAQYIERGSLDHQSLYPNFQTGIPSLLLANRPDVRAAEMDLASNFEQVNVAKRAFYPTLSLTASSGFSSHELKDWFSTTGFFANIASGLVQPVFNRRLNRTKLEIAQSNYREIALVFKKTLLVAGQEVSDALYSYETANEQEQKRLLQVDKLELAVDYTKKLLLYHSSTNYTDVLTSEQAYLSAQLELTNDRLLKWKSLIKLYRSLGGGEL